MSSSPAALRDSESLPERLVNGVSRFCAEDQRWVGAALACVLAAICGTLVYIGSVPTFKFGHDIFCMLDGAWRMLHGQWPSVDFYSSLGPFSYAVFAAGLKVSGYSISGVGWSEALIFAATGVWAWLLARDRMPNVLAAAVALTIAVVMSAPHPLGTRAAQLGQAMSYNRFGYGFVSLVLLECFLPLRRERPAAVFAGGASSAAVTVLALFTKASYGLVGVALIGFSLFARPVERRRVFGFVAGAVPVLLAFLLPIHFHIAPMLNDLRIGAAAKSGSEDFTSYAVRWATFAGLGEGLPVFALALLIAIARARDGRSWREWATPAVLTVVIVLFGAMLTCTNGQARTFPLTAVLAIMFASQLLAPGRAGGAALIFAELALALAVWLPFVATEISSIGLAAVWRHRVNRDDALPRFSAPHLASFVLFDSGENPDADLRHDRTYMFYLNDGLALLRRVGFSGGIYTMDGLNPFPYALLQPPPHGGAPTLYYGSSFNEHAAPSADRLFGDAAIAMIPKHTAQPDESEAAMRAIYLPALRQRFQPCAESDWWYLYKRGDRAGCTIR